MKTHILIILFFVISGIKAQTVYEPLHRDVYVYLSRISQKGVIEFDDNIKPLSRMYIADKLSELNGKMNELTSLEMEELTFYKKDFTVELNLLNKEPAQKNLSYLGFDHADRWRLFSYSDDLFKLNISPVLGFEIGSRDSKKFTHFWNGLYFYGYITDNIGFSFDFRDNSESGDNIDKKKFFSPATGVSLQKNKKDNIEYSEIRTMISASWDWGNISVGKDFVEWGYGESGKLVLSQKAPSYPYIRLDIQPVEWLKFNYLHAWLDSEVIDSSEVYSTLITERNRFLFRDKFLASHTLTVTPIGGLDISLGESIIYSDRLEISYLMPLMFFRLADHYLSNNNNYAGANSQFFLGLSSRNHLKNTHLYGTLFIDEITLSGLFDSEKIRNQIGFTLGGSVTDLPIDNLSLTSEFTKIYPFVYEHQIETQTYENSAYTLGHWIGHNANLFYSAFNYRLLRGLQAKAWVQYIRKGSEGTIEQKITQPQPPFLFGLRSNYTYLGFELKYEFIHELFIRGNFLYTSISEEQSDGVFTDTNFSEFSIAVYYGL